MKQVMEQYASAITAVLISGVLLLLFWGNGNAFTQTMQTLLKGEGYGKYDMQIGRTFDVYKNTRYPQIHSQNEYAIKAGQRVQTADVYYALTGDENVISVKIVNCWDKTGVKVEASVDEMGQFTIKDAGIYWVRLCATDQNDFEREVFAKLFVNER